MKLKCSCVVADSVDATINKCLLCETAPELYGELKSNNQLLRILLGYTGDDRLPSVTRRFIERQLASNEETIAKAEKRS